MPRDCGVIIVAAGRGERMGGDLPKQFRPLAGSPVLLWSTRFFLAQPMVREVVLVVSADQLDRARAIESALRPREITIVAGGARRQDSVANGLAALTPESRLVAIHDAARPFPPENFAALCEEARASGAAIFGYPIVETVKRVGADACIIETLDRSQLWAAQTPQVFHRELLERALRQCEDKGIEVTDDAAAVALLGHRVKIVEGSRWNIKLTVPEDWPVAECLAAKLNPSQGQLRSCRDAKGETP